MDPFKCIYLLLRGHWFRPGWHCTHWRFHPFRPRSLGNAQQGPQDPSLITLVSNESPIQDAVEFDVCWDDIAAVLPTIKSSFDGHRSHRKFSGSGTADQIQLLLKYMYTGSYDPADFSFRHPTPYNALFDGQMEFYLFCQKMQYKTLSDLVRVGIQSGLDLISCTPLPILKDMIHIWDWKENRRKHIFLLMYLFFTAHRCYSKLSQSDPLKRHFVRYASNLWREYLIPIGVVVG